MSSSVEEHYRTFLARHYTWMAGKPFAEKVEEQRGLLVSLGLPEALDGALALDLGCGPGFQTGALVGLGYRVLAVDLCEALLAELRDRLPSPMIETRLADLRALSSFVEEEDAAVICCMGDTLTHLPSPADVTALFKDAARALAPGGRLVLGYRDLSGAAPAGARRFIPVAADDRRILTCMVEAEGEDVAIINDLLHERGPEGWTFTTSSYRKLRLPVGWVGDALVRAGFRDVRVTTGSMVNIVATR